MSEITSISSGHRLSSQVRISIESTQKQAPVEISSPLNEIQNFEIEMERVNHAFTLVKEIRTSLESALRDLS